MEKYRIAVGISTLKDASNEAMACTEELRRKGIHAEWENRRYFFRVNTEKGHIEFIPYESFKIECVFMGKEYTCIFNPPKDIDTDIFRKVRVLENTPYVPCFLDWVLEKEKECSVEEETYDELPCSYCKSFPICSAKEEFRDLQKMLNMNIEKNSKVFKEARLVCPYYNPNIPTNACV